MTDWLIYLFIYLFIYWLIDWLIHSFIHLFLYVFIYLFLFVCLFVYWLLFYRGLARAVPGSANLFNNTSTNLTVNLRGIQCEGNENSLLHCPVQLNNGACGHAQDAGVICLGNRVTTILTTMSTTPYVSTTTLPPRICESHTTHASKTRLYPESANLRQSV